MLNFIRSNRYNIMRAHKYKRNNEKFNNSTQQAKFANFNASGAVTASEVNVDAAIINSSIYE